MKNDLLDFRPADTNQSLEAENAALTHVKTAKHALIEQSDAIAKMAERLGIQFNQAVSSILKCKGRVVVCGMGKSGLVGKKLTATLASTGTPSFYMHPAEAFHGDLGMLTSDDLVILISYSGETEEVIKLLPSLKRFGNKIIAMTGKERSTLAQNSDVWLDVSVNREVCPNNLAPTTSTLATMAMGDAMAVALIEAREFRAMDFARYHPGGNLGRKLLTRVKDAMRTNLPLISAGTPFHECLLTMTAARMGLVIVMEGDEMIGIVTDGDIRRAMLKSSDIYNVPVRSFMKTHPHTVEPHVQLADAEMYMREHRIRTLIVVEGPVRKVVGVVEIFD